MEGLMSVVWAVVVITIVVLTMRGIGAWMLRIDEVIKELKKINEKLDNR